MNELDKTFMWCELMHLGSNMWDDFENGPDDWAKSEAEEKARPNPFGPSGKRRSRYHSYLRCHDDLWRKSVDHAAGDGLNLVFIDLGEGLAYPSHPELAVAGTWSVEKIRAELKRLRAMGLEAGTAELLTWQTPLPIGIRYATPETLGADRIAAACGAWKLAGRSGPIVVIDAGTCITIDYIDAAGCYRGGAILPGMEMKFRALHTFTAKLPLLEHIDGHEAAVCGTTTRESLIAGVVQATRYEAAGFVEHYRRQDAATQLFVTGGDAARLTGGAEPWTALCRTKPDLVMIGLDEILESNIKN